MICETIDAPIKVLILEGNPARLNARLTAAGACSNAEIYAQIIRFFAPNAVIETAYPADGAVTLPQGLDWSGLDGVVLGGSALNVTAAVGTTDLEISNQLDAVRAALQANIPVLGSCWGLQIATVATGGDVGPSPNGREVGIARRVRMTDDGATHPFMAGRPTVFEVPCIHYDEVTVLPPGARVLATNDHSAVQALEIPVGQTTVWAVQYHPEFDLPHLAALYELYQKDMVSQGFFNTPEDAVRHAADLKALDADPERQDLAWRFGIDHEVLNPAHRAREIGNWLRSLA